MSNNNKLATIDTENLVTATGGLLHGAVGPRFAGAGWGYPYGGGLYAANIAATNAALVAQNSPVNQLIQYKALGLI